MRRRARVRVPATCANLGPGFDCTGLACDLWDEVEVLTRDEPGVHIEVAGEGAETVARDESHLVVATLRQGLVDLGHPHPDVGLEVRATNTVPHARGLGSSAAAVAAGLALAWGLARPDDPLDRDVLLQMATAVEGHPDNAAPAVHGGAQLAWVDGRQVRHLALAVHPDVRLRVHVPRRHVPTPLARHVLPESVPRADAVHQVLASSLLVTALTVAPEHLLAATRDWLHQPYRRDLMPESADLMDRLRRAGVAAVISGAGPTVLALGTDETLAGADEVDTAGFRVLDLAVAPGLEMTCEAVG